MNLELKDKIVIVTAGSRGIGKAIALLMAREGAKVAICARNEEVLKLTYGQLEGKGHFYFAADLTKENAPTIFFNEVVKNLGAPDILVHNLGGGGGVTDPLANIESWNWMWRYNFGVNIELNNLAIPLMENKKWGRIISISSVSGQENFGSAAYCSAKAALNSYTKCMGRIYADKGIIISAVKPGAVYSEGSHWERKKIDNPGRLEKLLKEDLPTHKFASPDEIANLVGFLSSPYASQAQGSVIAFDGGMGRAFF